ncbi:MAG: GGDEF domain-containing protein [Gammaproteobacteria bacterium]|nr:GGDEF domain-containing protein [Gammaproteobacteria bacterium]MBU0785366.1 GGDEF domain-containing protein [Gammaproteobacteria bacterium]MBU0815949.1 GGDEF domain-containing protein [Gammaproteobacteria bacterium]MBU1787488.1 GGDEF domain-containing protein [Gammaproteobacteria bacterium]
MAEIKPFEIARETLKQLTEKKLPPTPVNYQRIYNEVAGTPNMTPFPEEALRKIAEALPVKNPGQEKQRGLLTYAIGQWNWNGVQSALMAYGGFSPLAETGPASAVAAPMTSASSVTPAVAVGSAVANATAPALTSEFFELIARLVQNMQPALGKDDARFVEQLEGLLAALRKPGANVLELKSQLTNFSHRLSFAAEEQAETRATLLKLLHLIIKNIGELSLDDRWLKGQVDALLTASAPPLTLRRLDDVERRLKDVIFKQTDAKGRALEAQEQMRQMLLVFIERLSQMAESTSTYHGKMEEATKLLEQAHTLQDITPVLTDLIRATRSMTNDALSSRDELKAMREKSLLIEAELAKLHQELDRVSAMARHDTLTGALNRKGLDEAFERELANVQRKEVPLCVSLLDIDNFKALNDSKGHDVGDVALKHLATVARECMRPQDTLARYGGEEFVILLPDTVLESGIEAMTRLQRELTKRFFLSGTEKVLITFSAGVAQLAPGETGAEATRRADQAMYLAKRAGKNRVLGA